MRTRRYVHRATFCTPVAVLALAVLSAGCGKANETEQLSANAAALPPGHVPLAAAMPTGLEPLTQALLDSGNAAFRTKDFDAALAFYDKARAAQPDHAAPWFGTYMVAKATNNTTLADSALRMVRARAPGMQEHPAGTATPAPMPGAQGAPPSHYSPHQPAPPAARTPLSAPRS